MAQTTGVRREARNYRVMAGEWTKQDNLRRHGSPRFKIRPDVVPLAGYQNSSTNPTGCPLPRRRILIRGQNCLPLLVAKDIRAAYGRSAFLVPGNHHVVTIAREAPMGTAASCKKHFWEKRAFVSSCVPHWPTY